MEIRLFFSFVLPVFPVRNLNSKGKHGYLLVEVEYNLWMCHCEMYSYPWRKKSARSKKHSYFIKKRLRSEGRIDNRLISKCCKKDDLIKINFFRNIGFAIVKKEQFWFTILFSLILLNIRNLTAQSQLQKLKNFLLGIFPSIFRTYLL